jgi:hypothetical protein
LNTVPNILSRVFAGEFYRNNVTLFLLILAFAGGFMRGQDHLALGSYFVSSVYLLSIPAAVWTLYAGFIAIANRGMVKLPENAFLSNFAFEIAVIRWKATALTVAMQLIPAFAYATFLVALAAKSGNYLTAGIIPVVLLVLTTVNTFALHKELMHPVYEVPEGWIRRWVYRLRRHHTWFSVEGTIRQQFAPIAGYKILSLLLLFAASRLCELEEYDLRLPGMFALLAFALNITFVTGWHRFQNSSLTLYRQLPFTMWQRYVYQLIILGIFTLPEGILLFRNLSPLFTVPQAALIWVFGISINMFFHNFLYTKDRTPEESMRYYYGLTITLFLAILSDVPIWLMTGINLSAAFLFLKGFYYRFEYVARERD